MVGGIYVYRHATVAAAAGFHLISTYTLHGRVVKVWQMHF